MIPVLGVGASHSTTQCIFTYLVELLIKKISRHVGTLGMFLSLELPIELFSGSVNCNKYGPETCKCQQTTYCYSISLQHQCAVTILFFNNPIQIYKLYLWPCF